MKKLLALLFFAICVRASAQTDTTIYFTIPDPGTLLSVQQDSNGTVTPIFADQGINNIIANYTFTKFQKAFPYSRLESSQMVYAAVANSTKVVTDLTGGYPGVVPRGEIIPPPVMIGYHPNDYKSLTYPCSSCVWLDYDWYLDYIYAPGAWDYTHGDPSVVIGVTDNGFFVNGGAYEGNPDLNSKVAVLEDNASFPDPDEPAHGTMVAGLIAGATDNNMGYPAIGFNCMLDLSATSSEQEMLFLSANRGRKILNGSWVYDYTGTPTLDLGNAAYFTAEGVYNEIYENGTIACFAAGNSAPTSNWYYLYPASFDHNISVTGVMGENCLWVNGTGGDQCDEHNIVHGDSTSSYHHNSRVDICAPAVRVGGLTYDPSYAPGDDNRYYEYTDGWGTSFASPLVAGTLGLMLTENPCLSPYQLEYALKEGSRDIYGIPDNTYLAGPTRWTGRLGAGALDAEGSIGGSDIFAGVANFSCNDPSTQTFFIEGIELNTICAPGYATDSVKPKLSVILDNGTPPYIYKWEAYGGNTATLDNYTSATPTIVSAYAPYLAYFRLTVYDNSPIQKVANRDIKIYLTTANAYDLAMRDSYADMLKEGNNQGIVDPREANNIWASPDIWNRQVEDGSTIPQEAEYFTGGEPNYMYFRIRNVGCADYDSSNHASLNSYWTLASTGENWSVDWTTAEVAGSGGVLEPAGYQLATLSIPTLHPGDAYIMDAPWYPVKPNLYAGFPDSVDVCYLARIVEPLKSTLGMHTTEGTYIRPNVDSNNNIVTRNTGIVNLGHSRGTTTVIHRVYVGNAGVGAATFSLQLSRDRDTYLHFAGNLSEYMYVTAKLDSGLFSLWQKGGYLGKYASMDAESHTVTYDPSTPMQLDGITLQTGDKFYADLTFALRSNNPITVPVNGQKIYFRQLAYDSIGNPSVYGNVTYRINVYTDDTSNSNSQRHAAPASPAAARDANRYNVYPNPASDMVYVSFSGDKQTTANIEILDITGRLVMKQENVSLQTGNTTDFNLTNVEPGVYLINIHDATGYKNTYKITKIK